MSDISLSKLKFLAADYRRIRENLSFVERCSKFQWNH